jgi:hypothetical protein
MNLYGSLLMEKFRIGNVPQFGPTGDAHDVRDPTAFAVVTAIESGCKFNRDYYVNKAPARLSEWWRERGGGDFRKLIVHAENARPDKAIVSWQFMARNAMVVAAHPHYAPDLAPSDF